MAKLPSIDLSARLDTLKNHAAKQAKSINRHSAAMRSPSTSNIQKESHPMQLLSNPSVACPPSRIQAIPATAIAPAAVLLQRMQIPHPPAAAASIPGTCATPLRPMLPMQPLTHHRNFFELQPKYSAQNAKKLV